MNTKLILNHVKKAKQSLMTLLLLFALSLSVSCVDDAEEFQVVSDNPFGVGIIVFNSIPSQIWGNGIDQDQIKINTGLIPDGSTIDARITGTNLNENAAGCVLSGSNTIVNGMASFNFLNPIFIGSQGQVEPVNLAVSIEIPGDDTPDTTVNDFVSLLINAVGMNPPGDTDATPFALADPSIQFIDIEFSTFGIPPSALSGILAECTVSNSELGFVDNTTAGGSGTMAPIIGSTDTGRIIAKYFVNNGTDGGNQILTCRLVLPNPNDIDSDCENVPENERTIISQISIVHSEAPQPLPNTVTCTPNPITGGNDGICTCNGTNAAGLEFCINSPGPVVDIDDCTIADVNGTAVIPFDTDVVSEEVIEQVQCTITEDSGFFAQTNVTVNPAIVNSLTCEPNPVQSDATLGNPENDLVCTCDTTAPLTQICFETVVGDGEINFPGAMDPFCIDSDANGNAIMVPTIDGGIIENVDNTLQCCVDANGSNDCDIETTAQEVVNIIPFIPPVTSITCTAQQTTLGPDGNTFIDIAIDGFPFAQEVCTQIIIDSEGDATVGPDDDMVQDPEVICAPTDGNGEASIPFNAPPMIALQRDVTVRCFPDTLPEGAPDEEFTPGEISDIEVVTLDPNAGPPPVEVACNSNPGTVAPGEDSFITATLTNAGVGTDVCFTFFTNTSPASDLNDVDENDLTTVCSETNIANQAFAIFEADGGILIDDNATVICCADIGADGMTNDGDCTADDPQDTTDIAVDVPTISISCQAQDDVIGPGDDTFINIDTTGLAPNSDVCTQMVLQTVPFSELGTPDAADGMPEVACAITDALGNADIQFRGGNVPILDVATVRCFVDNAANNSMFDAGEISVTEQITVDPAAAPPAPQIACSPNPVSIVPGDNALITGTLMNIAPGADVCFELFTNTSPASELDDGDTNDDPDTTPPVETVCSTSNLANQAFATFQANAGIAALDTAIVQCCIDGDGGNGCDFDEPQGNTAVDVTPPPPSIISIVAPAGTTPSGGDSRFITVTTNAPVPAGTNICLFMQNQDGMDPELRNNDGDETDDEEPFPNTNDGDVICLDTLDGSGQIAGMFELEIDGGSDDDPGDTVTIVGCIDQLADGLCGFGDPLSNSLIFTVVP